MRANRLSTRPTTRLAAVLGCVCVVAGGLGVDAALGGTIGTVPPANPAANCVPPSSLADSLSQIDYCRAQEQVGPVTLPTNWASLTPQQQTLVIFNLERIGRGETPIVGLNSQLDGLAQTGANNNSDPSFPSSGIAGGGGVWAAANSTLDADYEWMYFDGPGGFNGDCTTLDMSGCWGHRDNILINSSPDQLIGGAGYAADNYNHSFNSYAFEMDYDAGSPANYPPDAFTWASELPSFATAPGTDPLPVPSIGSLSPSSGSPAGGTTVTITGTALSAVTRVAFNGVAATNVSCSSDTSCTAVTPAGTAGTVSVAATNPAGESAGAGPSFTYGSGTTTGTTTTGTTTTGTTTTGTTKTTVPVTLRVGLSRIRVVRHTVSFTLTFRSGSATISVIATRANHRAKLRARKSGKRVAVSGVLGVGRWTVTLRFTPSRGVRAHVPAVVHLTVG